jgi:hypothetical protein
MLASPGLDRTRTTHPLHASAEPAGQPIVRRHGGVAALQLPAQIYHLAEAANWPSIQKHGLLSTSALLDWAALPKNERDRYEQQHRPHHTELPSGVQIRDQKPMPTRALERCLVGLTPAEWYRLINSKVFFWLDPDRLNRQRAACESRPQIVLIVDTERLLSRHADRIALSPINSGSARRKPAVRGRNTFVSYAEWSESGWSSGANGLGAGRRAISHRPVELTVETAVRDIMECVVGVKRLGPGELFRPNRALPSDRGPRRHFFVSPSCRRMAPALELKRAASFGAKHEA